ncbi:MAG: hypothetical protein IKS30_04185 [Treponema sp.]|nr:hypothetical protein [Treponema sp.]
MKRTVFFVSAFTFILSLFPLASQESDFSGEAGSLWAAALRSETCGDFILGDTYLKGKFQAFYGNSSACAEGRAGFDGTENTAYWNLNEIYIDYSEDFWAFRAGRQKAAWGKADGIDITNVICPKDYSSVSALFEDESLAVDAARLSLNRGSVSADFYFIPVFTPASLPEEKTAGLSSIKLPEENIKNAEYGLKVSGYFSKCDLSLYGFYGWEDMPFLSYTLSSEGVQAAASYKRMAMLGADAAVPLGETVLRLEGAFFPGRHFQVAAEKILSGSESSEGHNNLLALAGLDWMREGWTFTAQYYCDYVSGKTEKLDRSRNFNHGTTLSISKSLFAETLELSASCVLNLNDLDSAAELSAEYSLSDSIFLEAGGYIFNEGREKGTYGEYKDMTSVYLKARYVF